MNRAGQQYTWVYAVAVFRPLSYIVLHTMGFLRSAKVASTLSASAEKKLYHQQILNIKSVSAIDEAGNLRPQTSCQTCLTLNWRLPNPIAHKLLSAWNADNRNVKHNELWRSSWHACSFVSDVHTHIVKINLKWGFGQGFSPLMLTCLL